MYKDSQAYVTTQALQIPRPTSTNSPPVNDISSSSTTQLSHPIQPKPSFYLHSSCTPLSPHCFSP
ncbi:hypothetical protein BCR44DRAFT_1438302 [Catenaria anguillulae PL171]|uniref:Uncharacterized protein n=1 Tax=Catenaria anguillulae PL171 TaxID=765915 RepID=A0A1Y2HHI9_9FUNG|nr:hypothetical protein BCR44DRAFT_1438302 [Catenaria anguillulae PL171]